MAEQPLTARQRDALAALSAARGPCPAPEALVEYEALTDDERRVHPIHAHVQVCSRCQLVLMNLEDPALPVRPRRRWMLPLAAALAFYVGGSLLSIILPQERDIETVRGTELQPISPSGDVTVLSGFRWQSPIRAAKYRVTLFRGSQPVWTGESVQPEHSPPGVTLEPGDYEWQVDAIDAEGVVRMSSPRTRFTLGR